jgi:hypothetical protein
MPNERLSELVRDANPVTRDPTRPVDVAWGQIVAGYAHSRVPSTSIARRTTRLRTHRRRLFAAAAAILLIAGVSTVVGVRGTDNAPSLTNDIARAFGVVNANAATSGGFSTEPGSPQGSNHLSCPSSTVCYLESTNIVNAKSGLAETTTYKTTDGGTDWTSIATPTTGNPDTPFSCSSVSVCSIGVLTAPAEAPSRNRPNDVDDHGWRCHVDKPRGRDQSNSWR